jgi:sortase A
MVSGMRRGLRIGGTVMIVAGALTLVWAIVVWRWEDPFTGLYTHWQQHRLAQSYDSFAAQWPSQIEADPSDADLRAQVAREATRYRRATHAGQAIGRIVIGRIGLKMIVVDGTDHDSLRKGPGRDLRTYMPGENRLVYIAGHRTTYLAPFSHIEEIRRGDTIRLELPYATFVYRAIGHEIVPADDLAALHSPRHELLRLQACHPRFFASHRYLVDARLVSVRLPDGKRYTNPSP